MGQTAVVEYDRGSWPWGTRGACGANGGSKPGPHWPGPTPPAPRCSLPTPTTALLSLAALSRGLAGLCVVAAGKQGPCGLVAWQLRAGASPGLCVVAAGSRGLAALCVGGSEPWPHWPVSTPLAPRCSLPIPTTALPCGPEPGPRWPVCFGCWKAGALRPCGLALSENGYDKIGRQRSSTTGARGLGALGVPVAQMSCSFFHQSVLIQF